MIRALAFLLILVLAAPLRAAPLVELFTSQGCASCPEADAILEELVEMDPEVVALALHVDYWDYIGWRDTLADPRMSARQRAYARTMGLRAVYTPQFVINGEAVVTGAHPMKLAALLARAKARPEPVAVTVQAADDTLRVRIAPRSAPVGAAVIHLARFLPRVRVTITRGENAGRTLTYVNAVREWQTIARWNGREPILLEIARPAELGQALIVQRPQGGPVLTAVKLP